MTRERYPEIAGLKEPEQRPDLILVNSPINDYTRIPKPDTEELPAFGLAHIATECEVAGFNVGVLDAETLAMTPEQTAKVINRVKPKWVGVNMLTPTFSLARRIVANIDSDIPVIAGAAHAKAMPEQVLRDPVIGKKIKAIALEDGEYIVRGILQNVEPQDMGGVAYIDHHDRFIQKPFDVENKWIPQNLDLLHFADRKFLPGDPFESQGKTETNSVCNRGCAFNCKFCAGARDMLMFGIRSRSIDNILSEMQMLREQGVNAIRYIDDLFLANKRKMAEFFNGMVNSKMNQDFVWDATGRVNTLSTMDNDLLSQMAVSGCREVSIGVESGSQRVLNLMDKSITPDMVRETVRKLSSVGIRVKGYFILGYPSEQVAEMDETVDFMHELRQLSRETAHANPLTPNGTKNTAQFRGSMFEFRPYPGTPVFNYLTGKTPWPNDYWQDQKLAMTFTEDELLLSFRPVFMDGLEVRQKHNFTTDHPFSEALPYQIQDFISSAMITQRQDINEHGEYLPDLRSSGTVYRSKEVESE